MTLFTYFISFPIHIYFMFSDLLALFLLFKNYDKYFLLFSFKINLKINRGAHLTDMVYYSKLLKDSENSIFKTNPFISLQ